MIWSYSPNHFPSVIVRLQTGDVIIEDETLVLVLKIIDNKTIRVLHDNKIKKIELDRSYLKNYDLES